MYRWMQMFAYIVGGKVFGVGIRTDMERDTMRTTTYTINEVL